MAAASDGNGVARRKEATMGPENSLEERRICGTCHWYDQLVDLCRNPASPHERDNMERGITCKRWEPDK